MTHSLTRRESLVLLRIRKFAADPSLKTWTLDINCRWVCLALRRKYFLLFPVHIGGTKP